LRKRGSSKTTISVAEPTILKKQKTSKAGNSKLGKKSREDKPDFEPLYTEHRKILEENGVDISKLISLRRQIH
jgi:metal-dependent amidase/aminoacylase/carboxypeptidase family protein